MRIKSVLFSVAFVLSLTLNGAAVGYLYAQWSKSKEATSMRREAYIKTERPAFLSSISEDKRQVYQQQRKENTESLKGSYKKLVNLRRELLDLLGAENFSEEAYKNKLEEIIALQNEIQRKRIEPTLKLAETLSSTERQRLVEQLKRPRGYRQPTINQKQ